MHCVVGSGPAGVACAKALLARGGLSNVWGAAMLPYRDADIADWPIKSAIACPASGLFFPADARPPPAGGKIPAIM
jgi:hypothetical protein